MGVEIIKETLETGIDSTSLLRQYLEGDANAGEVLATQIRTVLYRRFRRLAVTSAVIDELVQDCMLQVFARLPEYSPIKGAFDSWIGGFAVNALRTHRRRESRARTTALPVEELQELSYDPSRDDNDRDLLTSALDSLDVLDRELLYMRFSLGMSSDEIATSSDLNAPQVRKRISRAVERLRRHPAVGQILN